MTKRAKAKKTVPSIRRSAAQPTKEIATALAKKATRREANRAGQKRRRAFRRQLGFCADCKEPALPQQNRCQKHLDMHSAGMARQREKRALERGWRLVRVPL